MAGRLRENLGEGDIMLGKMVKVLIAFALGFVMGIVGAFAGVGLGGLYAASNVKVGTVTGYILSDKQNEEYLNEKFRSAYLYDAAKMLIKAENLGVVKNYIPGLEKGLDSLLDIELNASNGEKVRVGDLVEIDKAKLYATTYKNIGDAINAVTVTANIETVLKLLGVNLNDLGFGWIENLEIYKGAEYSKYPNEGIGDVAFRQISPQEAASYQGSVYTKSGNTYTLVEKDDGKTQSLRSVVTYYVLNDGFDYKTLPKYYYVDSSETYRNIYEVGDVKLVNNDEYVIEQVTYLPSVTDLAEVWFMEFPALSKIGLLDIPKVIVRRLKNMPINDFAIALENLVPLDMEYNKLLSAIVGTDENGTINDVLNFDYKNIRLNDIADATKLIPEGSVITSLIDLITTKNGKSLGLADTFENLKDLSFNDVIDEFGLGFDLNDYGLDAALGLKIGTIFDGSILNKLKDSYLDKSFDDVIEIVCNITGLKFTLADFGLEDFGKIKFASIVNGTMTDELKTALYDISVQKVIDVLNKNLKLSIDLADYGIKELGSITVGGLINAPVDTLKDALSGKKVGDVVEKILEKLNVNFDPSDYNLDRIFDITFDGIFDGSIGKDFLDAFGSYSFNEIIAIIFEKLLHIDYSLSDFGVGEFGELKLSDIFDGTISDDVMKTLEKKTFNSLIDPISERFKLNFSLDDFGLYEVGELTFGDIFDGTIIDDALEILDDKTINYFIDKITNKFNVKFDLEDFALEAFGTITIGDIVRGQIGEKALDALYSITFDRVLDVVRKYSGLSIDLDYYKLGALKDINVGGVIKGTQLAEMKQALNESGIAAMLSKVGVNVDELGHVQTLIVGGVLGTVAVVTRLVFPKLFKTLVDNRRDTTIGMIMDGIGLNVDLDKFGVEGLKNITIGEILTDLKKAIGDNLGDLSINKIVEVVTNLIGVEFSLYDYDLGGFGELSLGDVLDGTIGEDALNEVKAYTLDRLVGIVTKITKTDFTLADFALESFGGISIGDIFDGTIGQDALDALYGISVSRIIDVVNDKAKLNINLNDYKLSKLNELTVGSFVDGSALDIVKDAVRESGFEDVLKMLGMTADDLTWVTIGIIAGVGGAVALTVKLVFPKLFDTLVENGDKNTVRMLMDSIGITFTLADYDFGELETITLADMFGGNIKDVLKDKVGEKTLGSVVDTINDKANTNINLDEYGLKDFGELTFGDIIDGTIGQDAKDILCSKTFGFYLDKILAEFNIEINYADYALDEFLNLTFGDIFDGTIGKDALNIVKSWSFNYILQTVLKNFGKTLTFENETINKLLNLTIGSIIDGTFVDDVKSVARSFDADELVSVVTGCIKKDFTLKDVGLESFGDLSVGMIIDGTIGTEVKDRLFGITVKHIVDTVAGFFGRTITFEDATINKLLALNLGQLINKNVLDTLKNTTRDMTLDDIVAIITGIAKVDFKLSDYELGNFGKLSLGMIYDGNIGTEAYDEVRKIDVNTIITIARKITGIDFTLADFGLEDFGTISVGDIVDGTAGDKALDAVYAISVEKIIKVVNDKAKLNIDLNNYKLGKLNGLTVGSFVDGSALDIVKDAVRESGFEDVLKMLGMTADDLTWVTIGIIAGVGGAVALTVKLVFPKLFDTLVENGDKNTVRMLMDSIGITFTLADYDFGELETITLADMFGGNILKVLDEKVGSKTLDDIIRVITDKIIGSGAKTQGISTYALTASGSSFTLKDVGLESFGDLSLGMIFNGTIGNEALTRTKAITFKHIINTIAGFFDRTIAFGDGTVNELLTLTIGNIIDGNILTEAKNIAEGTSFNEIIAFVTDTINVDFSLAKYGVGDFGELTVGMIIDGTIGTKALDTLKAYTVGGMMNTIAGWFDKKIEFTDETINKLLDLTFGQIISKDVINNLKEATKDMTLDDVVKLATDTAKVNFELKDFGLEDFGKLSLGMIYDGTIGQDAKDAVYAISVEKIITVVNDKAKLNINLEDYKLGKLNGLSVGSFVDGSALGIVKEAIKESGFEDVLKVFGMTADDLTWVTIGIIAGVGGAAAVTVRFVFPKLFDTLVKNGDKNTVRMLMDAVGVKFTLEEYGFGELETITLADMFGGKILDVLKDKIGEKTFSTVIDTINEKTKLGIDVEKYGVASFFELTFGDIFDGTIKDDAYAKVKEISFIHVIDTVAGLFGKVIVFNNETVSKLLGLTVGDIIDKSIKDDALSIAGDMTFNEIIAMAATQFNFKFRLSDYDLDGFGELTVGMVVRGKLGKEALNVLKQYSFNRIIRIPLDKIGYEFDWGSDTISAIFDLTVGSIIDKHFVADLKEVAKDITFKEIADLGFRFAGYKFEVTSETVSKLLALTVGDIIDGSIVKDAKAVAEELSIKEALNIVLGFAGKKIETESKLVDDLFTITAGDIINNKVLDRIKEITAETTFNEAIEVIVSAINVKFDLDKIGIYDLGELKISYIFEKNIKDKALEIVKTYSFDRIIDTVARYFNKAVKIDSTYINELLTLTIGDVMDGTVKQKAKEITANMTFDEVIEFVTKLMGVKFSLADYKLDELGKLTVGMIFVTKDLKQQIGDIVYNWSIEDVINKILGVNGNVLAVENIYLKKIVSIKLEVVIKGDISGAIFDIVGDMSIRDILSVANVELTVLEDYGLGGILDLTVNELKSADVSDKIKAIIDGVKLVDVLGNETVENNELLKSIAYDKDGNPVTIGELSTRINVLTIGELVEGYADGDNFKTIRAIIPADTKITEISSVDFNANILNLTIGDFENFKLPTLVYKAMGFGVQGSDGNWYRTETDAAAGDTAKSHLSIKLTEVMDLGNEDFMNLTADDLFGELTKENDGLFYTVTHKDGKALTFNELKGRVNTLTVSEIIDGYETNAEFELIRKIIAPDTVVTAIGTNLTTEKILSSITLKDIGLSGNESIRNILGYTYKGTDGKWYDSSESAAAMAEGTDYENVTVDKISALFDVKNVLNMKAKDVGIEVGTMPAALRKVLGYKLNADGEWVNNAGNNFNDVTVNELTNITTEGFKNLALSDVLSESDVSGNKILSLLYNDSTVTLANIGEKINELSLKDIIGNVELMDEVEITAAGAYVTDTVLYTLETSSGTNVYTMVDGATLDMDSGKYTYNNLKTGTYYKINNTSKVWFITFMEMENDPDPAENVVGAVTKLTEKKLTLNDLGELNKIQLGGTKLKVLLDIGLLSGSLNVSGYDMTMNQLISNIPENIGA